MKNKQKEAIPQPKARLFAIEKLVPYEKNPRTHPEQQVEQLMTSIQEFGFVNPIVIDSQNRVIAGHGRLMAANRLGMEKVPCVVVDHLTEKQRRAYIIADNRIAMSSDWDMELLKEEVRDLEDEDFDLDALGFTIGEIEDLTVDLKPTRRLTREQKSKNVDCPHCGQRFKLD